MNIFKAIYRVLRIVLVVAAVCGMAFQGRVREDFENYKMRAIPALMYHSISELPAGWAKDLCAEEAVPGPSVFPSGEPGVSGGLLGVAGRLSGTVSPFRAEQGTSLETPSRARASSCQAVGTTWFFSSCGGILELQPGIQASSSTGPGKSSFHSNCELELGIALETLQGQIDLI